MIGRSVGASVRQVDILPVFEIVRGVGGADRPVTAVYLGMWHGLNGHIVLMFDNIAAAYLVDLLLEQPAGTTTSLDGELEQSALQEVGNVTGSGFLNALARLIHLQIQPTPPRLVQDMCGAVFDGLVAMLALEDEEALLIDTEFDQADQSVQGHLLILPDRTSLATLLQRVGS
jgi:chemotaxis protein CheC